MRIIRTTWSVHHASSHNVVKARLCFLVRYGGLHNRVYLSDASRLVLFCQGYQHVTVRESSFLPFHYRYISIHSSENLPLEQIFIELLQLNVKNSGDDIRSIGRRLSIVQLLSNLSPCRIARERDEEVRFSVPGHNGHGILIVLYHCTG
ncbi:unnamed protein product [Haemonchus placei]|uniref:Uncharacterized protein n=1 Tax=Haemonchus placei TaxID=6290 RepID=A0A3P7UCB0_HAEPC|nr:unnamed protein product [Haemonchus placei]